MHRFFINTEIINNKIKPTDDFLHQAIKVLRIKENEDFIVINNGLVFKCNLINKEIVIKEEIENEPKERNTEFVLVQGVPSHQKLSTIIQKSTELDVDSIVLWQADRSTSKLDFEKKKDRFEKIIIEACEQTRRNHIPSVSYIKDIAELYVSENDLVLVAYENEKENYIKDKINNLDKFDRVIIVIGPEGGLADREVDVLKDFEFVSLGKNILRTETAGLFALSVLNYEIKK